RAGGAEHGEHLKFGSHRKGRRQQSHLDFMSEAKAGLDLLFFKERLDQPSAIERDPGERGECAQEFFVFQGEGGAIDLVEELNDSDELPRVSQHGCAEERAGPELMVPIRLWVEP